MRFRNLGLVVIFLLLLPVVLSQGAIVDESGEWWVYAEGPEINETKMMEKAPNMLEAQVDSQGSCVWNGTEYNQGQMIDVGQPVPIDGSGTKESFEAGGWYNDYEICLNIRDSYSANVSADDVTGGPRESDNYFGQDQGGEWHDIDQWYVTRFIRDNTPKTDNWTKYWRQNPDVNAHSSTGVVKGRGIALEDDCYTGGANSGVECEDIGGDIGFKAPYVGNFSEGSKDDDHNDFKGSVFNSLKVYHNRVQSGGNTGHIGEGATTTSHDVDYEYEWDEGTYTDTNVTSGQLVLESSSTTTGTNPTIAWTFTEHADLEGNEYVTDIGRGDVGIMTGSYDPSTNSNGMALEIESDGECSAAGCYVPNVVDQETRQVAGDPSSSDTVYFAREQPDELVRVDDWGSSPPTKVWTIGMSGLVPKDIEVTSGGSYIYYGGSSGTITKIDKSRNSQWSNTFSSSTNSITIGPSGSVYAAFGSGKIRKFDASSGSVTNTWSPDSTPTAYDIEASPTGAVYYAAPKSLTNDNGVTKIDSSGSISWEKKPHGAREIEVGPSGDYIYVGTRGGRVHKLDNAGNQIWEINVLDSEIKDVYFEGGKVLVAGKDSGTGAVVRGIEQSTSTVTEYKSTGSYTSKAFSKNGEDHWQNIQLDYSTNGQPASLTVEYSSSSSFSSVSGSQTFSLDGTSNFALSSSAQYARFKLELESNTGDKTPEIGRVTLTAETSGAPAATGGGNTQDQEPPSLALSWANNSHINPKDDEWALTPSLSYGVANDGVPYAPFRCHGAPRAQGEDHTKREAVYANSYVNVSHVYSGGNSSISSFMSFTDNLPIFYRLLLSEELARDGNWIDPDNTSASASDKAGFSCDLTGRDWGYGYANKSAKDLYCKTGNCNAEENPLTSTQEIAINPPHTVKGNLSDLNFDYNNDPGEDNQNDLRQYPRACGDDPNEYLMRVHAATIGGEDNPSNLGSKNDKYACADRSTDCVYNGSVYSQGELIDISREGGSENGVNAHDQEMCVDLDPDIPGGEWVDPDNETARNILVGTGTPDNPQYYVREREPISGKPRKVVWHNTSDPAAVEARDSPYNEVNYATGYALEDDCDPAIKPPGFTREGCDDSAHSNTLGTDSDWMLKNSPSDLIYSPFEEEMMADDGNVFEGFAIRTYVSNGTTSGVSAAHGSTTGQDMENVANTNFDASKISGGSNWPTDKLNDSTINDLEDTWAVSNFSYHAVGPTGNVWDNGSCYGRMANASSNNWVTKDERVMGNSFARAMEADTSDSNLEGVWVDPDSTIKTTLTGGLSCDLNLTDWGIGFNTGENELKVTHNDSTRIYEPDDYHVATGNITFDINSDPNGVGASRNLKQFPNACGDDRNEYLIREHIDSVGDTEQIPEFDHTGYYVCADRISDCAYHGGVYSEGQLVDVSDYATDEESGVNSVDEEVCVDADSTVPGGEWYDIDNESLNKFLKGPDGTYDPNNTDTYEGLVRETPPPSGGVEWFTPDTEPAALEAVKSPYHGLSYGAGYALEDDCGRGIEYCEDSGTAETHFEPDAVYSYFEEGRREDDENVFQSVAVKMWVGYANGTAFKSHGKSNAQDEENVPAGIFNSDKVGGGNWPTAGLNDSTIDPKEDTWALSNRTYGVVDPTGRVYMNGSCYGLDPWTNPSYRWVDKDEKVVGNSYAMAVDVNGDGTSDKKGVWVNPDSTRKSAKIGTTSCDLNRTDWGYGFNISTDGPLTIINGSGTSKGDVRGHGYVPDSQHVVIGDIPFDINSDPMGEGEEENLKQYPNACGDDRNEYLIREHRSFPDQSEHNASLKPDNIYGCTDRISDCVFNGSVYSMGQTVDVSRGSTSYDEELGVDSTDAEICVDSNKNIPGGEWMDVDNESARDVVIGSGTPGTPSTYDGIVTFKNASGGVHWFNSSWGSGLEYPALEAKDTPYNPVGYATGYALEDDCDPELDYCEDTGRDETWMNDDSFPQDDLVYTPFIPGEGADDRSVFSGKVHRMYVGNARGYANASHGASNNQDDENTKGLVFDSSDQGNWGGTPGFPTTKLNDSTIQPNEDTWAIVDEQNNAVGPTGYVWNNGSCYGRNALSDSNYNVSKEKKVVGNSYAMAVDVNGDGTSDKKGIWVDPDSTRKSATVAEMACDLNARDWGYGFNTDGKIQYGFNCEGYSPETDEFKMCDRETKNVDIGGDTITLNLVGTGTYADGTVHATIVNENTGTTHTVTDDPNTGSTTINGEEIKLSRIDGTEGNSDEETEVALEKVDMADSTSLTEIRGDIRTNGYTMPEGHVVSGSVTFDINSDPYGRGSSENLQQYPNACGDDQNEYLIREHRSTPDQSEHDASLTRDNIYVCADRITDCAYNGSVYSMGQTADVSGTDEELGVNSNDAEVCVDSNPNIPGGEWMDVDNETARDHIIGSGDPNVTSSYEGFISYRNGSNGVHWFNYSWGEYREYPALEAANSSYNPVDSAVGFALEDDCGENVTYCEDSGADETHMNADGDKSDDLVYSPFIEDFGPDDKNTLDGYVLRMYVGGSPDHYASINQEEENVKGDLSELQPLNDSTIQPNEDTWAIGDKPWYAVGPTGAVYPNGSCYGGYNEDWKGGTVVANAYALAHDADGDGDLEGDWVNPDNYPESVIKGQESCELSNMTDWGLGFNEGPGSALNIQQGAARDYGYNNTNNWKFHVVSGNIPFDSQSDPYGGNQENEQQYPDACGDDRNEHLIREHTSNVTGDGKTFPNQTKDEFKPNLGEDNIYGCTDDVSDCVYDGQIYSEGQLAPISETSGDDESGVNSTDWEACIDSDKRIPGGEWHDVDNQTWRDYIVTGFNESWYDSPKYEEDNVTDYYITNKNDTTGLDNQSGYITLNDGNNWFTNETAAAAEVEKSPYNPLNYSDGYALEDDCDPDLDYCQDIGPEETHGDIVYSAFEEEVGEDDSNVFSGVAVRMYVGGSAAHGANNNQMYENAGIYDYTEHKWGKSVELNDSEINENEDTWAIADKEDDLVGPTGKLYDPGSCYGANTSQYTEDWIKKNQTVVANSFALSHDIDGDGDPEGDWVNPDTTQLSLIQGKFSCEINTTDWGIGYNTGSGTSLVAHYGDARTPGYEVDDKHAVSGPITFDYYNDPPAQPDQNNITQYNKACGDDSGEYLIREHGSPTSNEFKPNLSRDNIYGCTDRITDCVYNGYIYGQGETIDISRLAPTGEDPEKGDDIKDEEICLDLDKSMPGGEWYDKDNNWTVRSKIMELNRTSSYTDGPSGSACTYTLEGEVIGAPGTGKVEIRTASQTIDSEDKFTITTGLKCGSTQVLRYKEGGNILAEKRIALPGSPETIEGLELNVEASFDPIAAWSSIKSRQDHDFGYNPGTDWKNKTHKLKKTELEFFNQTGSYPATYSQYSPEGYATEDDCGKVMQRTGTGPCGDVGPDTQDNAWFSSGNFSFNEPTSKEGAKQDNYDTGEYSYYGVHNRIQDSSNQLEPGAETERNWNLTGVYGSDYKIYDSEDSTKGPDKWALTRFINYSVDNRGKGYPPGNENIAGCYYKPGVAERTGIMDSGVTKKQKAFGNSFANASDIDDDGVKEGVWEDPDEVLPSYANFSCDITGPDKGYGHDTGDNDGKFHYKNNKQSTHTVIGDVAFAETDGKDGSFDQEPPVCGDDHKEYLLEELGESRNSLNNTGRWGCGTDRDDCVARSGGEYALYRNGDLVDTNEASESFGRVKEDKEICRQRISDTYGVWYDQDLRKDYCQVNNLYGSIGIRWMNTSYIDRFPYSVAEGIDDDLNPYLAKRGEASFVSTQGNVSKYLPPGGGETPVPTGRFVNKSTDQYYSDYSTWTPPADYHNLTATKGFCAGDDIGENLIVQKSSTELLNTNYSVVGVASSPDDCVLDRSNYESIDGDRRKIYSQGEKVKLEFDTGSERVAACYGGRWYSKWPVVFLQENVSVEEESKREIAFKVINVEEERTTYEIELNADKDIEPFTEISQGAEFEASVPAESSKQYTLEVYGQRTSLGPENITVRAQSLSSDINGSDTVTVDVVDNIEPGEGTAGETSEVPGIGVIQLIVIMMMAGAVYYTQLGL